MKNGLSVEAPESRIGIRCGAVKSVERPWAGALIGKQKRCANDAPDAGARENDRSLREQSTFQ